jgi:hypothetical protein
LVDAHGSGPCAARCGGSSPLLGTTIQTRISVSSRKAGKTKVSIVANKGCSIAGKTAGYSLLTDRKAEVPEGIGSKTLARHSQSHCNPRLKAFIMASVISSTGFHDIRASLPLAMCIDTIPCMPAHSICTTSSSSEKSG